MRNINEFINFLDYLLMLEINKNEQIRFRKEVRLIYQIIFKMQTLKDMAAEIYTYFKLIFLLKISEKKNNI